MPRMGRSRRRHRSRSRSGSRDRSRRNRRKHRRRSRSRSRSRSKSRDRDRRHRERYSDDVISAHINITLCFLIVCLICVNDVAGAEAQNEIEGRVHAVMLAHRPGVTLCAQYKKIPTTYMTRFLVKWNRSAVRGLYVSSTGKYFLYIISIFDTQMCEKARLSARTGIQHTCRR